MANNKNKLFLIKTIIEPFPVSTGRAIYNFFINETMLAKSNLKNDKSRKSLSSESIIFFTQNHYKKGTGAFIFSNIKKLRY